MAQNITTGLVIAPVSSTQTISVFTKSMTSPQYGFTLDDSDYVQLGKTNMANATNLAISNANVYAHKLNNLSAARISKGALPNGYLARSDGDFDKDGNYWFFGYHSSGNVALYKIPYNAETEVYGGVTVHKKFVLTTDLGWNNYQHGHVVRYDVTDHSIIIQVNGQQPTTADTNTMFKMAGVGLLRYRINENVYEPYSFVENLGLTNAHYSSCYPNSNCNWYNTYESSTSNMALSPTRRVVYLALTNRMSSTAHNGMMIVVFNLASFRYERLITVDGRYNAKREWAKEIQGVFRLHISERSEKLYIIDNYHVREMSDDLSTVVRKYSLTPLGSSRADVAFNNVMEEMFVGSPGGGSLLDIHGDSQANFTDQYGHHAQTTFYELPTATPDTIIGKVYLFQKVRNDDGSYTLTFRLSKSLVGATQHITAVITNENYNSDGSSKLNSTAGGWEQSTDLETWTEFSGTGKRENGVDGTDGVLCDATKPVVYVRVTTPQLPDNQDFELQITNETT
jgi:hypothetical protein